VYIDCLRRLEKVLSQNEFYLEILKVKNFLTLQEGIPAYYDASAVQLEISYYLTPWTHYHGNEKDG
jgi:hypothetical protein